jgi:hypothetical protein
MDQAGDDFFPDAALTGDEYFCVGAGSVLNVFLDSANSRAYSGHHNGTIHRHSLVQARLVI